MKVFPLRFCFLGCFVAVVVAGAPVKDASAAISLVFSGPKVTGPAGDRQGLVAHGIMDENPIFDELGNVLANHPQDFAFNGVYTELTSTDGFDFTTGDELAFSNTPTEMFQASAPSGHGLSSIGVTADDSNPLWLSVRGLVLDTSVASDYFYDTNTDIEHRTYRGGQYVIYEETAPDTYQEVLAYQDVVVTLNIDWIAALGAQPDSITAVTSGDPWTGPSGLLPLFDLTITNSSSDPIGSDGSTAEGIYAIFPTNGDVFEVVPEPSRVILGLIGLGAVLLRRQRG